MKKMWPQVREMDSTVDLPSREEGGPLVLSTAIDTLAVLDSTERERLKVEEVENCKAKLVSRGRGLVKRYLQKKFAYAGEGRIDNAVAEMTPKEFTATLTRAEKYFLFRIALGGAEVLGGF